jgi:geranylgeranyl diphosphate synthase type II
VSIAGYLEETREKVDQALYALMPRENSRPVRLVSAMRHSLFAGGKRIRPILVLAAAGATGGIEDDAMLPACALELVHTYSLIHDDLPAMDMAFDLLSAEGAGIEDHLRLRMVQELSRAAGWRGMVGGQQVDMDSEGSEPELPVLEYIHTHKTGALIRCSLILGGLSANADEETLEALANFGEKVGLAFQVVDDILDVTATTEEMGKDQGSDAERGKVTYPGLFGLEEARKRAFKLVDDAKAVMNGVDSTGRLAEIADFVLLRRL